ncbi:hypothetical protein M3E13_13510 [Oceanobacillus kimchii]|uniref:hypothetical protein n=1 Tax=Oceanobacillus kimchii TaxID=746691 RepID=UPI0021A67B01|nr:hypothetical protein [Oceanobacillus kimchii]MCT1577309.1 hypothetical protein [Oceanobacillus kimchii]MCT2136915.1 hypothetical protein [Oceanobacillus kimchii]
MEEWSNDACLGYVISGARQLGYSDNDIRKLIGTIYGEFDFKTVSEAKEVFHRF